MSLQGDSIFVVTILRILCYSVPLRQPTATRGPGTLNPCP